MHYYGSILFTCLAGFIMGEKLSRGIRIHNRKEKSLARKQGRKPDLIGWTLPTKREKPAVLKQSQVLHYSPIIPSIGTDTEQLPKAIVETPVTKQRRQPTDMSFIDAGSRLSTGARQMVKPSGEESHENLSDQQAVIVLETLEDDIRSGKILSQTEIAKQALRLGGKMGIFGSVTTEIDIAAWRVLDAIKENRKKLTK